MHIADFLQLEVPVPKLLRGQVLAVALMSNVVVLAKHTAQVAHAEKDGAASVVTLNTGLFTKVRCDDVDLGLVSDQTHSGGLITVYTAEARTQIAIP